MSSITITSVPLTGTAAQLQWVSVYFKPNMAKAAYNFNAETTADVFYSPIDGFLIDYCRINPYYGPYPNQVVNIP